MGSSRHFTHGSWNYDMKSLELVNLLSGNPVYMSLLPVTSRSSNVCVRFQTNVTYHLRDKIPRKVFESFFLSVIRLPSFFLSWDHLYYFFGGFGLLPLLLLWSFQVSVQHFNNITVASTKIAMNFPKHCKPGKDSCTGFETFYQPF